MKVFILSDCLLQERHALHVVEAHRRVRLLLIVLFHEFDIVQEKGHSWFPTAAVQFCCGDQRQQFSRVDDRMNRCLVMINQVSDDALSIASEAVFSHYALSCDGEDSSL